MEYGITPGRDCRGFRPALHAAVVALLLGLVLALVACQGESVHYGAGIRAPEPPLQESISERQLRAGDFTLTTRARFAVSAKVLAKRRYRWDDLAGAAPWDFAVAWGVMSDEAVLEGTKVVQGDRLMYWHLYDLPLPLPLVERSSANLHLIPASPAVGEALDSVPRGAIVHLRGELVDLTLPDGRRIPTSLSRQDRGVGACEILHVAEVTWDRPQV